jgi:hypothetical protein
MRLDGCSHEVIALALAESAVDTLAAAGFPARRSMTGSINSSTRCANALWSCAPSARRRL